MKHEKARNRTKTVSKLVVGFTVGSTLGTLILTNTHPTKRLEALKLTVGAGLVSAMVADMIEEKMNEKIDQIFDVFDPAQPKE
jgi:uncharacterized membrane protein